MRSMMSLAALTVAATLGGTPLAAEGGAETDRTAARGDDPVIEMKVDEDAVPEEQRAEEDNAPDDEASVEMKVDQPETTPRESWTSGDTPANSPAKD